jgi:hypothetical protein
MIFSFLTVFGIQEVFGKTEKLKLEGIKIKYGNNRMSKEIGKDENVLAKLKFKKKNLKLRHLKNN